jgi:hypothetical protein
MKRNILTILVLSLFLLPGCYSFFRIDADEYKEIDKNDTIKITLEDKEAVKIKNIQSINLTDDKIDVVDKYFNRSAYLMKEIKEVSVEKFDFMKTILTPVFISLGIILVFVLLGGSMSPGG